MRNCLISLLNKGLHSDNWYYSRCKGVLCSECIFSKENSKKLRDKVKRNKIKLIR